MNPSPPHRGNRLLLIGAALALSAGPLAVTGATPAAATPAPVTYWASPDGAGTTCTQDDTCALSAAQAKVRHASGTMRTDITVMLADGTYRLRQPLTFDAAQGDSATAGHTITYQAAPGTHPVLSGGERVTGWRPLPGGVWSATVPAGTDTRQLYVDGVRAARAAGRIADGFTRTATGYTTTGTTLAGWQNITDVEFVYNVGWTQMRCRVAAASGTTVTMDQPCFDNSTRKQYGVNADRPDQIENAKELLNDPGEWYLDQPAHTVYYIPRPGQELSRADVEIPRLQTLVSGTGTRSNPLTGLVLKGLSFEYAGWTAPNGPDGFSEVQANTHLTGTDAWEKQGSCDRFSKTDPGTCPYGDWTMTPGNVVFDHTTGLVIADSVFNHLGAAGLQLGRAVTGSTIRGNTVTDTSANGIEIGNGADADPVDVSVMPSRNTIADNWVHNVAVEYTGGVGIFQGYTRYDTIAHNQINDVPYSGISSNWGWGRTPTQSRDNAILNNLVFDHMQLRSDGGGIYVLGQEGDSLADGLVISGNVVRNGNSADGGHAIYTDGGSQYVTMTGNAMFSNGVFSMGGCRETDGTAYGDFSFTGNYVENTTPDWPCGNPDDLTLNNIQVGSDGSGVPAAVIANAGLEPQYAYLAAAPVGASAKNLAAGTPAVAQYLDGSTATLQPESRLSYATDGDPDTYVQASGQFRWQLVVDLQRQVTLGYITVGMPQPHFATDFHVDASNDGTQWTTVGTVHDSGWGSIPVDFASPLVTRYLRIVAEKPDDWSQRGDQMAISEIGAYTPITAGDGNNLALGRPTKALFTDGTQADMQPNSVPAYGTDGDPGTWAQATGRYRWALQVDLQRVRSVDVVSLLQPGDKYATALHIDVSVDGSTFWTVARRIDSAGGVTGVHLATPAAVRYIRITADRPNDWGQQGGQMAISELAVYGLTH